MFYEVYKVWENGIIMVVIGVGDMNVEELKGIVNGMDFLFIIKLYDIFIDLI